MLKKVFEKAKSENRALCTIFLTCGDPSISFTEKLVEEISASGADIIELGVPFTDPMADGPTIQASSQRAIQNGASLPEIINMVSRLRAKGVKTPLVLFGYFNLFFKLGVENAAKASKDAGADAWLVADLPLEEFDEVLPALRANNLDLIPLAAPTTPLERIRELSEKGSGFLYYIMFTGVTGARGELPKDIEKRIALVRENSSLPIGAGFGISSAESAKLAAKNADSIIIGSKFVDLVYKTRMEFGEDAAIKKAKEFVFEIASALRESPR